MPSNWIPLADQIWTATAILSAPGGVRLPLRATLVRTAEGLWLHSPIPFDDALADALRALGPLRAIVAPNKFHHLYLPDAAQRFPDAALYAVPGLPEKRADVAFAGVVWSDGAHASHAFGDAFVAVPIHGASVLNEVVYYHVPSRTLITTDLVFNIQRPATFSTHLALALMGTRKRLAQSRFFHFYSDDKMAMRASLEHVLALPFQRVLMAHGDVFEHDHAPEVLRGAMWMTRGRPSREPSAH